MSKEFLSLSEAKEPEFVDLNVTLSYMPSVSAPFFAVCLISSFTHPAQF